MPKTLLMIWFNIILIYCISCCVLKLFWNLIHLPTTTSITTSANWNSILKKGKFNNWKEWMKVMVVFVFFIVFYYLNHELKNLKNKFNCRMFKSSPYVLTLIFISLCLCLRFHIKSCASHWVNNMYMICCCLN